MSMFSKHVSESRNVLKEVDGGGSTVYRVEFVTTTIRQGLFGGPRAKVTRLLDDVSFSAYDDAEFYAKNALKPSRGFVHGYTDFHELFLVHSKKFENELDLCIAISEEGRKYTFRSDCIYNESFGYSYTLEDVVEELTKRVNKKNVTRKCISTFNFNTQTTKNKETATISIPESPDADNLYAERNYLIDNEIARMERSITFLKSLKRENYV